MASASLLSPAGTVDAGRRRVSYFYSPEVGDYKYREGHPMEPLRVRMAHTLISSYGVDRWMSVCRPFPATVEEMGRYHSEDYLEFLASATGNPRGLDSQVIKRFNVGEDCGDCPFFDGFFPYCQTSAGGSIGAAIKLNHREADITVNWAGGLHHAKKGEASGFYYVNDVVLAIIELLKTYKHVLYVDIDVHHGDGVEEAFFTANRVMTVSFYKYGDFFPGTGAITDVGAGEGKHYAVNVPLSDGIDDATFCDLFRCISQRVVEVYQPDVIVLQCGADSLAGDRLGCFNLSVKGHANCLQYLRSFNIPMMVLGGGGYTINNVARCWCYETAVAVGAQLDNKLHYNEYYEYFGPDYHLHIQPKNVKNLNSRKDRENIKNIIFDHLSKIEHAPNTQFSQTISRLLRRRRTWTRDQLNVADYGAEKMYAQAGSINHILL